jgi:hypothetical protein
MADLSTAIEQSAAGPAQASGDGQSVTQHNIKDLIEADKYLAKKTAVAASKLGGMRCFKISPPGAI